LCYQQLAADLGRVMFFADRIAGERNATKHSAEKIDTNVKIIRFSAATGFCMTCSAPFAHT
jgi:hypothetical protein